MDRKKSMTMDDKEKKKEPEVGRKETYPDICVCCGKLVPEGWMICWSCEHEFDEAGKGARST